SKESKKSPPRESKKFKELPLGELRVQRITTRKIKSPKESPGESKESTNRRIKSPKESLGEEKEFTTRKSQRESKESKRIVQRITTGRIERVQKITTRELKEYKESLPGESKESKESQPRESKESKELSLGESKQSKKITRRIEVQKNYQENIKSPSPEELKESKKTLGESK
ncbi:6680_t:CDS:2, partial [Racocetra fulgida]